jgi:hypothetical protein
MHKTPAEKQELFKLSYDGTVHALAEALRNTIRGASEGYLEEDPENAFIDMACQFVLELSRRALAILPIDRREGPEAAERTLLILTDWLRRHPDCTYSTRIDCSKSLPFQLEITGLPQTATFQGLSAQDMYAQAAQAMMLEAL